MSRNFHDPKHYDWKGEDLLVCRDIANTETLFAVFDEGKQAIALNAFWTGFHKGEKAGRQKLERELRLAIGLTEDTT